MNKHILFDKLTASIASATLGKNKFFSESLESPGYKDFLEDITVCVPSLEEGIHETEAKTPVGKMDPAYYVAQWKGNSYPTIIYHHGNNERPFDFSRFSKNSFKNIFLDSKEPVDANLIAIRAAFHNASVKDYQKKVNHLSNFVGMLSVSVRLVEEIIHRLKEQAVNPVLVSGISLGGWVTNLHRAYYNTANAYVPLLAGAALDHLFTDSGYRKMDGHLARKHPEKIKETLNFEEDFQKVKINNVFPLLGKYDEYIQYERQRKSYSTDNIKVLNTGHITGFMATDELRQHIISVLSKL
ncbi:MAG: alpha/beta hydrolase family protein [Prolixibacteraceae bacterium]|nr:alpha/beta hydrolase family protein [Prolixibacteraceae bacterium]